MKKFFARAPRTARWSLGIGLACLPLLLATLALVAWLASSRAAAQGPISANKALINLFFTTRRFSTLEPCGCHTQQRGGVQYEGTLYGQHGTLPQLHVDAGQWTTQNAAEVPVEMMMTRYLLRAMTKLDVDAENVAWSDAGVPADFLKSVSEKYPEATANLVSANLYSKSDPTKRAFAPWRIVKRTLAGGKEISIGIAGLTAGRPAGIRAAVLANGQEPGPLENPNYHIQPPAEAMAAVIAELRPKVDLLVVLFDGTQVATNDLATKFQQIDFLVSGGYELDPGVLSTRAGHVHLLCVDNSMGKEVGFAPLTIGAENRWELAAQPQSLYVSLDMPADPRLQALIDEFKQETKTLDTVTPPPDVKHAYGGADSCRNCHAAEYTDWQGTQHAHALATLINKSQESDPACLQCHTVGFRKDNGFYSINQSNSRQMANVQCENCHGPAYEHQEKQSILRSAKFWMAKDKLADLQKEVEATNPPKQVAEAVCIQCHTQENDGHFVYNVKAPKVDHHGVKSVTTTTTQAMASVK